MYRKKIDLSTGLVSKAWQILTEFAPHTALLLVFLTVGVVEASASVVRDTSVFLGRLLDQNSGFFRTVGNHQFAIGLHLVFIHLVLSKDVSLQETFAVINSIEVNHKSLVVQSGSPLLNLMIMLPVSLMV